MMSSINAFDGNINTKFYSSAGATVGSYIRVDLGKEIPLYDTAIYYAGNPKGPEHGIDGFAATKGNFNRWCKLDTNWRYYQR